MRGQFSTTQLFRVIYTVTLTNIIEHVSEDISFFSLSRPKSNSYRGRPFVPRAAVPVDMFPHTNRCELILLFERL